MRWPLMVSRRAGWVLVAGGFAAIVALVFQVSPTTVERYARPALALACAWAFIDLLRSALALRGQPLQWERRLPAALARGVPHTVACTVVNNGPGHWWVEVTEEPDAGVEVTGLPLALYVPAHTRVEARYGIVPLRRGTVRFPPAMLRLTSLHGTFEAVCGVGAAQTLRVQPDFTAVARYAWLASQQRLREAGIASIARRGTGTERLHLARPAPGEAMVHIAWKAMLRHHHPVERRLGDARDQCVMFLLDCGSSMRSAAAARTRRGGPLDQALDALMLLAHVALDAGDAVGAMTFGTAGRARRVAARQGLAAWPGLMAALYDVQPRDGPSDLRRAACELMQALQQRAFVVVLTQPSSADAAAIALLRSRHLVVVAAPADGGVALVNRYRDAKRSGSL